MSVHITVSVHPSAKVVVSGQQFGRLKDVVQNRVKTAAFVMYTPIVPGSV